jgi:hypothetical protein
MGQTQFHCTENMKKLNRDRGTEVLGVGESQGGFNGKYKRSSRHIESNQGEGDPLPSVVFGLVLPIANHKTTHTKKNTKKNTPVGLGMLRLKGTPNTYGKAICYGNR